MTFNYVWLRFPKVLRVWFHNFTMSVCVFEIMEAIFGGVLGNKILEYDFPVFQTFVFYPSSIFLACLYLGVILWAPSVVFLLHDWIPQLLFLLINFVLRRVHGLKAENSLVKAS